jgi:ATP-dependent RNA helicase DeaD
VGQIERLTKAKIERIQLPRVSEIREKILEKSMVRFTDHVANFKDEEAMHFDSFKAKFDALDKDDLIKGVYGFMFENTLKRYQKAQEIDIAARPQGGVDRGVRVSSGMQRFFINLGKMDGVTSGDLLKFVAQAAGINGRDIGRIDTKEKFAFIEANSMYTDAIMNLKGEMYGNRRVSIELAEAPSNAFAGGGRSGGGYRGNGGGRSSGGYRGNGGGNRSSSSRY